MFTWKKSLAGINEETGLAEFQFGGQEIRRKEWKVKRVEEEDSTEQQGEEGFTHIKK